MTTKEKWDIAWALAALLAPILSYLIGKRRNLIKVPKPIAALLANKEVMDLVREAIADAETMKDKTDDQKREYVRQWAKSELYKLLGDWLSDSTLNFLIEHLMVRINA